MPSIQQYTLKYQLTIAQLVPDQSIATSHPHLAISVTWRHPNHDTITSQQQQQQTKYQKYPFVFNHIGNYETEITLDSHTGKYLENLIEFGILGSEVSGDGVENAENGQPQHLASIQWDLAEVLNRRGAAPNKEQGNDSSQSQSQEYANLPLTLFDEQCHLMIEMQYSWGQEENVESTAGNAEASNIVGVASSQQQESSDQQQGVKTAGKETNVNKTTESSSGDTAIDSTLLTVPNHQRTSSTASEKTSQDSSSSSTKRKSGSILNVFSRFKKSKKKSSSGSTPASSPGNDTPTDDGKGKDAHSAKRASVGGTSTPAISPQNSSGGNLSAVATPPTNDTLSPPSVSNETISPRSKLSKKEKKKQKAAMKKAKKEAKMAAKKKKKKKGSKSAKKAQTAPKESPAEQTPTPTTTQTPTEIIQQQDTTLQENDQPSNNTPAPTPSEEESPSTSPAPQNDADTFYSQLSAETHPLPHQPTPTEDEKKNVMSPIISEDTFTPRSSREQDSETMKAMFPDSKPNETSPRVTPSIRTGEKDKKSSEYVSQDVTESSPDNQSAPKPVHKNLVNQLASSPPLQTPRTVAYFSDETMESSSIDSTATFSTMKTEIPPGNVPQEDESSSMERQAKLDTPVLHVHPPSSEGNSESNSQDKVLTARSYAPSSIDADSIATAATATTFATAAAAPIATDTRQEDTINGEPKASSSNETSEGTESADNKAQSLSQKTKREETLLAVERKNDEQDHPTLSPLTFAHQTQHTDDDSTTDQNDADSSIPAETPSSPTPTPARRVDIPKLNIKGFSNNSVASTEDSTPVSALSAMEKARMELSSPHRSSSQQIDTQEQKEMLKKLQANLENKRKPPPPALNLEDLPKHREVANEVFSAQTFSGDGYQSRSVTQQQQELQKMEQEWRDASQAQKQRLEEMRQQQIELEYQLKNKTYKKDSPADELKRILQELEQDGWNQPEEKKSHGSPDIRDVPIIERKSTGDSSSTIVKRTPVSRVPTDAHSSVDVTEKKPSHIHHHHRETVSASKPPPSPVHHNNAGKPPLSPQPKKSSYFQPQDVTQLKNKYDQFVSVGVQAQLKDPLPSERGVMRNPDGPPVFSLDKTDEGRPIFLNRMPRQTSSARESTGGRKGRAELEALFGRSIHYAPQGEEDVESHASGRSDNKSGMSSSRRSNRTRRSTRNSARTSTDAGSESSTATAMITSLSSPLKDKKKQFQKRIDKKVDLYKLAHLKQLILYQIKLLNSTVRDIFKKMDKDNSGLLSKHEFVTGMKEYLCIDGDFISLFKSIDRGNTGMVEGEDIEKSLRDQYRMMQIKSKVLSLTDKFTLENIFEMWAYDRGQHKRSSVLGVTHATTLKFEQFRRGCQQSRLGLTPSEISLLFGSIDIRAVGRITFDEFEAAFSDMIQLADNMESLRAYRQRLNNVMRFKRLSFKQLFDIFDMDNSNYIDFMEFKENMQTLCKVEESESSDLLLRTLFTIMDVNGDGEIEYDEFETALKATEADLMHPSGDYLHSHGTNLSAKEAEHHADILPIHEPLSQDPIVNALIDGLHDDEEHDVDYPSQILSSIAAEDEYLKQMQGRSSNIATPERRSVKKGHRLSNNNYLSQALKSVQSPYYESHSQHDSSTKGKRKSLQKQNRIKRSSTRIRDYEPNDKVVELDEEEESDRRASGAYTNKKQVNNFLNNFFG